MQSAAGYYIGRSYFDNEFGFEGPYSRETNYMSEIEANETLAYIKGGNDWPVRDCIENNASYAAPDGLPNPHDNIEEQDLEGQEEFHAWSQECAEDEAAEYRGYDYGDDDIPF